MKFRIQLQESPDATVLVEGAFLTVMGNGTLCVYNSQFQCIAAFTQWVKAMPVAE